MMKSWVQFPKCVYVWNRRKRVWDNEQWCISMHKNSFCVYGNKTELFLMDRASLNKTSCLLFPSGPVFSLLLHLALLILGLVKGKKVLAMKTDEKGLMVWGTAKKTLCTLFHIDPQVPEVFIKREEPPMRWEFNLFLLAKIFLPRATSSSWT